MKNTKRILSAILSLCMILGCFAAGFSVQASAADLVALIESGNSVEWTGGDVTLDDTLVINGDRVVDLNGAVITGPEGKTAVEIKGNVTLRDGVIVANNESYRGATAFLESLMNYKPAIRVTGGNVVLECVTAVGSLLRVPNTSTYEVTIGNGINADAGNVIIKNSIAVGMNALDNDNKSSKVTIEDTILVGVYKACNNLDGVTFAEGYSQYKTIDFLEEFLKDGVSLSASEKKYLNGLTNSEGDLSVASVLVSVKDPSFVGPTSSYDAETDVLTVVATADNENVLSDVANRYSYRYTPDTCTIDGVTADFVEQADGTYAATFENIAADATLDAELDYSLSVKMGAKQKEFVLGALDMVAKYAAKAPELLGRFIKDFEGDRAYGKLNDYINLLYGAYNDLDAIKNEPAFKKFMGVIYALRGQDFTGNTGKVGDVSNAIVNTGSAAVAKRLIKDSLANQEELYGKVFDTDGDGVADSLYAFYGETWGEGLGVLEVFDEHYANLKALALTEDYSDFNDIGAAAEYVGENYETVIELVEKAVELVEYAYGLLEDPDLKAFLGDNISGLDEIIEYADKALADGGIVDKLMAKFDEYKNSSFITTYGDRAPELCKKYALKVLDIAENPTKYFDVNSKVEGDYINVFSFVDNAVITTPADETVEYCNVTVTVAGYGKFSVNGEEESVLKQYKVEKGEYFSVLPVEYDENDPLFRDYVYTQPNGSWKVVSSLANFRVGSDITITLNFSAKGSQADEDVNIIFLTDGNLGYNWIGDYDGAAADVDLAEIEIPEFKGMTFAGWSLDKDAAADAALTDDELLDAIVDSTDDFFVYAVYEVSQEIEIPDQTDIAAISAEADETTSRVYFGLSVKLPENCKAIEAGVIVSKNSAYELKLEEAGSSGLLVKMSDMYGDDGYLVDNLYYNLGIATASGTVYGRGYVIYKNLDTGAVETIYTDIVSGTLA